MTLEELQKYGFDLALIEKPRVIMDFLPCGVIETLLKEGIDISHMFIDKTIELTTVKNVLNENPKATIADLYTREANPEEGFLRYLVIKDNPNIVILHQAYECFCRAEQDYKLNYEQLPALTFTLDEHAEKLIKGMGALFNGGE